MANPGTTHATNARHECHHDEAKMDTQPCVTPQSPQHIHPPHLNTATRAITSASCFSHQEVPPLCPPLARPWHAVEARTLPRLAAPCTCGRHASGPMPSLACSQASAACPASQPSLQPALLSACKNATSRSPRRLLRRPLTSIQRLYQYCHSPCQCHCWARPTSRSQRMGSRGPILEGFGATVSILWQTAHMQRHLLVYPHPHCGPCCLSQGWPTQPAGTCVNVHEDNHRLLQHAPHVTSLLGAGGRVGGLHAGNAGVAAVASTNGRVGGRGKPTGALVVRV